MKTLIGVLLYRPGYKVVLEQLARANPGLRADLVLTNDTGMELDIDESLVLAWGSVTVLDNPRDIFDDIPGSVDVGKLSHLRFKRIALWQNVLLLYALQKGYDNLLFWEDDQRFYFNGDEKGAFFSSQVNTLNTNRNLDICVSKRQGYLHRVPPFITGCIPGTVLTVVEKSLCLCNEIVFSGLMTKPAGGFVPYNGPSPYGGVEYFGDRPFIYAGSLAINLHSSFPCFYDVPDLPGQHFSRGNDTFFSLGFDGGMTAGEVENTYFHDPYMVAGVGGDIGECFVKPVECGSIGDFLKLIKGWLSYSGLLLRVVYPGEWKSRLREIDLLLRCLPGEFGSIYDVFREYSLRVNDDYTLYRNVLDVWREVCGEIRFRGPLV